MSSVVCPSCGASNPSTQHSCASCYSPLRAAKSAPTRAVRQAVVVRPTHAFQIPWRQAWTEHRAAWTAWPFYRKALGLATVAALAFFVLTAQGPDRDNGWAYIAALIVSAAGMAAVLRAGGLDLSVAAVAATAAWASSALADLSLPLALILGIACGAMVGWVNGTVVRHSKLPAVVATLCTAALLTALLISYGVANTVPPSIEALQLLATAYVFVVPAPLVLGALAALLLGWLFNVTTAGRDSLNSAANGGALAPTGEGTRLLPYVACGGAAGLAGVLLASTGATGREVLTSAWSLLPIAAALLGGAMLTRRRGAFSGAAMAGIVLGVLGWRMHTAGLPLMEFFFASLVAVLFGAADSWKECSLAEVREYFRDNRSRAAEASIACLGTVLASWFLVNDVQSRVPGQSALILRCTGEVLMKKPAATEWTKVQLRTILEQGDQLRTGSASAALMKLSNGSVVKVTPNTELAMDKLDEPVGRTTLTQLNLSLGRVYNNVRRSIEGESTFEVHTANAVAAVRGTLWSVATTGNQDYVSVLTGNVQVRAAGSEVLVTEGKETLVRRLKPPERPRAMSEEERSSWMREQPVLENPTQKELWEVSQKGQFVSDDFNDGQIDPALWFLRDDQGVAVQEGDGKLVVSGTPPKQRVFYSYGATSTTFDRTTCEATVEAAVTAGSGAAVLRLADERGSGQGVAVAGTRHGRFTLWRGQEPDKAARSVVLPSGSVHQLALRFDAGTRTASGYVDGTFLGSTELRLGNTLHYELLYEGTAGPGGFDCRFDNFHTNIVLPVTQMLRTAVAVVFPEQGSNDARTFVFATPMSDKMTLRDISVIYPKRVFKASTRLLAQQTAQGPLSLDRKLKTWYLEERGFIPARGDYIFNFVDAEGHKGSKIQRCNEEEFPVIANLRDSRQGLRVMAAWDPVADADSYWVDLVDARNGTKLFSSDWVTETHATVETGGLKRGAGCFVVVYAHRMNPYSSRSLAAWKQAADLLVPRLRPNAPAYLATLTPQGSDEFVVQCGQLRKL